MLKAKRNGESLVIRSFEILTREPYFRLWSENLVVNYGLLVSRPEHSDDIHRLPSPSGAALFLLQNLSFKSDTE
jgi:hypothetical protein